MSRHVRALCEPVADVASPLSVLYADAATPLPIFELVADHEMPEPYRSLLVHERDMTSTLEAHHGQGMSLRVLRMVPSASAMTRKVVLVGDEDGRSAEFGAIRINLGRFDVEAQDMIRESRRPFGAILRDLRIDYTSRPTAYFGVHCDTIMAEALDTPYGTWLYGRHNQLRGTASELLAEVVEILPPEQPAE